MSRDKKPVVDITNRPSNKSFHSCGEWLDHIHVRESTETRRDIRDARSRLGRLTVRAFAETFCYDDPVVRDYILDQLDPDHLIGSLKVSDLALRKLADRIGGAKAAQVVGHSRLREKPEPQARVDETQDREEEQVRLLKALLKTMDPAVLKKALSDE